MAGDLRWNHEGHRGVLCSNRLPRLHLVNCGGVVDSGGRKVLWWIPKGWEGWHGAGCCAACSQHTPQIAIWGLHWGKYGVPGTALDHLGILYLRTVCHKAGRKSQSSPKLLSHVHCAPWIRA